MGRGIPAVARQRGHEEEYRSAVYRDCRASLQRGSAYLVAASDPGGGWSDFATNRSGSSTSWVAAHVLWQAGDILPSHTVALAVRSLTSQRQVSGGWGFSASVPPDCDSTIHALQALRATGRACVQPDKAVRFALLHQQECGGFATYLEDGRLGGYRNAGQNETYDGWTQAHVCVTSVAVETLRLFPRLVPEHVIPRALAFLLRSQEEEGFWRSYWWRSKYFATARIIRELDAQPLPGSREAVERALSWISDTADHDGYWSNGYDTRTPCMLSTAACVGVLGSKQWDAELLTKSLSWIVRQQKADGSWAGAPTLRIPPPAELDPDGASSWRVGGRGVGSCCSDEKRIYTTAAVIGAIQRCLDERRGR